MKSTLILVGALALAAFTNLHAQAPVTASSDTLYLPPTVPGLSPGGAVVFTNHTDQVIQVYGANWNGPYDIDWLCVEEGGRAALDMPPRGRCALIVRYLINGELPLGVAPGIVGFRLSTGTIPIDIFGFFYTNETIAGVRNISTSLPELDFDAAFTSRMTNLMGTLESVLVDGRPQNDRSVCGRLGQFSRRAEDEAARGEVSDWSAVSLVTQASAVASSVGCQQHP